MANKKKNKYSLKSIIEQQSLLRENTNGWKKELKAIEGVFQVLFGKIDKFFSPPESESEYKQNLSNNLKKVGWNQIQFKIDTETNEELKRILSNSSSAFHTAHKEFTKNIRGDKPWRAFSVKESTEGKAIDLTNSYPQSFCDKILEFRSENPEIYDALIFNYAELELKTFYEKIIENKLCVPDENVSSMINDIVNKELQANLLRIVDSFPSDDPEKPPPYSKSEKIDPQKIIDFNSEIVEWFKEQLESEPNKNLSIEEKFLLLLDPESKLRKNLYNEAFKIARELELPRHENTLTPEQAKIVARYRAAEEKKLRDSPSSPGEAAAPEPAATAGNVLRYLATGNKTGNETGDETGNETRPGRRGVRTESIRENFNLKSLSLKEAMEIEYD